MEFGKLYSQVYPGPERQTPHVLSLVSNPFVLYISLEGYVMANKPETGLVERGATHSWRETVKYRQKESTEWGYRVVQTWGGGGEQGSEVNPSERYLKELSRSTQARHSSEKQ